MAKSESFWDHPIEKLEEALHLKRQIQSLQEKLSSLFSSKEEGAATAAPERKAKGKRGGKRVFSAETRAKMAAAQRARHARSNGTPVTSRDEAPVTKKRKLSPEGRARIVAAQKARHAARKGGR